MSAEHQAFRFREVSAQVWGCVPLQKVKAPLSEPEWIAVMLVKSEVALNKAHNKLLLDQSIGHYKQITTLYFAC